MNFISQHHAAVTGALMAAVHFAHLAWPKVKGLLPTRAEAEAGGGCFGILWTYLFGKGKGIS